MGELFDRYVVVDWSAASRPVTGPDSIWIAVLDAGAARADLVNPPTRAEAAEALAALRRSDARTLVAVDASLGYPRGSAKRLRVRGDPPWRAWWQYLERHLEDDASNRNNRFEVAAALNQRTKGAGPFWGRPANRDVVGLAATKPASFRVHEFRHVEAWLRARGLHPASGWQLLGAGSVGSQTLTVLPVWERLLRGGGVDVWPFTTGLAAPTAASGTIVLAETWPTAFGLDLGGDGGRVRDAAQVDGVAAALAHADRSAELATWFAPALPASVREVVEAEEGWVLAPPAAPGPG